MTLQAFPSETRRQLYLLLNGIAPLVFSTVIGGMLYGRYTLAWMGALIVVLLMESRIQIGIRLPRMPILWFHILSSALFFVSLTVLAFVYQDTILVLSTWLLLLMGAVPGSILWYRGVAAALS